MSECHTWVHFIVPYYSLARSLPCTRHVILAAASSMLALLRQMPPWSSPSRSPSMYLIMNMSAIKKCFTVGPVTMQNPYTQQCTSCFCMSAFTDETSSPSQSLASHRLAASCSCSTMMGTYEETFLHVKVTKHWDRLHREVMQSTFVEMLTTPHNTALSSLLRGWMRCSPRCLQSQLLCEKGHSTGMIRKYLYKYDYFLS